MNEKKKVFKKGTELEDLMDFVRYGVKWDDEDCPEKTQEEVIITIAKKGD